MCIILNHNIFPNILSKTSISSGVFNDLGTKYKINVLCVLIIVQLFLNIIFPLLIFPAISFNAENRLPSTGYILTMLNNRSQNVTVSSLFPCYAGDIFFSNFLDAYRSCVVISSA